MSGPGFEPPAAVPPPGGEFRLGDADAAFVESPVSVLVCAQGIDGEPEVARAIAARFEPGSGRIRVCLRVADARALIDGALHHDRCAAMFSRPRGHVSIQVKGDRVRAEQPDADDEAARRRYPPMLYGQLLPLGFDAGLVGCIISDAGSALCMLSFRPTAVFDQTPGPRAGERRPE
ncbi:MAG: hypothetical protein R3F55_15525 [Alphaproteobacteria bacterium]